MGGTYELSNFEDRQSQYPTRRKLIHNPADEDNVFTVQRDEGTVTKEGISFSANMMNTFDEKIGNMFPVSIANGGTGATTKEGALRQLGLNSISGTWVPILSAEEGTAPTYTTIYYTARYTYQDPICYISFHGKWNITNNGSGYACITGLPYKGGSYDGQALALREAFGAISNIDNLTITGTVQDGSNTIKLRSGNGSGSCQWQIKDDPDIRGIVWVGFSGAYFVR